MQLGVTNPFEIRTKINESKLKCQMDITIYWVRLVWFYCILFYLRSIKREHLRFFLNFFANIGAALRIKDRLMIVEKNARTIQFIMLIMDVISLQHWTILKCVHKLCKKPYNSEMDTLNKSDSTETENEYSFCDVFRKKSRFLLHAPMTVSLWWIVNWKYISIRSNLLNEGKQILDFSCTYNAHLY